ncbi:MAG: cobalamin biosynthesis protein CobQ [Thermotogae bacterium]|nr:cobalamin biosynthesis protein CobQ [Thermotogota bacterium]MCP5465688.1 cobalamin biosynthesis protein CobQ [Thermotogota bacterium]
MINRNHKVFAFIGMFGSGKTEIALNLAIDMKKTYEKVAIADIDVISPYFRTRDERENLKKLGIVPVLPPERFLNADLPIIPPNVGGYIENPEFKTILDVGGNDDGAVVLGSLNNFIKKVDTAVFFVINPYRPFTDSREKIIGHIRRLSDKARTEVSYLVVNPNIMDETTPENILKGEKLVKEVSEELGIPVAFTAVLEKFSDVDTIYEKFLIKRYMKVNF